MTAAARRCKDDIALRLALLVIGLFFLTIAVPLYLKMYAVSIAWAAEGAILTIIAIRYKSMWTQAGAAAALLLSFGQLMHHLPLHSAAFQAVFNPAFGSWCFLAAAVLVCHIIYRRKPGLFKEQEELISQFLYAVASMLFLAAIAMEWYWHCAYNFVPAKGAGSFDTRFTEGMILLLTIFTLLQTLRPVCPAGILLKGFASIFAVASGIYVMIAFTDIYNRAFPIFINLEFAAVVAFIVVLFASAILIRKNPEKNEIDAVFAPLFALLGIFTLWVTITEEIYLYWWCRNSYAGPFANWQFLANMYTSIAWAAYAAILMTAGFLKKLRLIRYAALGLFAVLLLKVFIMDMSTVKSVYRIAAFLATGVTMLAVSYLYQYLKKKGFFENIAL
jgi:uncharacterized membrane protein